MRILYFTVSSGVLIGLVLIVRRLFRKQLAPEVIYALWLLPLVRLLLPFGLGGLPVPWEAWDALMVPYVQMEQMIEDFMDGDGHSREPAGIWQEAGAEDHESLPAVQMEEMAVPKAEASALEVPMAVPKQDIPQSSRVADALTGWCTAHPFYLVWLCGSLILCGYALAANWKLKKTIRRMETIESIYSLPVCYSSAVVSPCLFGLFRPCILLNQAAKEDEALYRQVIRHELTHYRQKDHVWTFLRVLLCVCYWWNPFVWAAAVYSQEDAELACDSRAVRRLDKLGRKAYGLALLRLLEQAERKPNLMYGATAMSGQGRSMKRRIEGITENTLTRKRIFLPVCLVLTAALLYGCAVPKSGSYIQCGWEESSDEHSFPALEIQSRLTEPFQSRLVYTEVYKKGQLTERRIVVYGELDSLNRTTKVSVLFPRDDNYEYDNIHMLMEDGGVSYEGIIKLGESYGGLPYAEPLEKKREAVEAGEDLILLAVYGQQEEKEQAYRQISCEELMEMTEEDRLSNLAENDLVMLVHMVLSDLPEEELCAMYEEKEYFGPGEEQESEQEVSGSAQEFVQRWIDAFIERDGDALVEMMTEEVEQQLQDEQMLSAEGEENYFGWSSPWPMFGNELYRILSCTEEQAEILYYAGDSTPHLSVWRQTLTLEQENGEYKVAEDLEEHLEAVYTAEEFYHAYPDGIIVGTAMDYSSNGLGEALNDNAKRGEHPVYERLFDPATAAGDLLNLADGPTGARIYAEDTTGKTIVHITFLLDGSTVDVEMVQPYGKDGIWIPQDTI